MKKKELLKRITKLEKQVNSMRSLQVANACIDAAKNIAKSIEELDSNWDAEKAEQFNKFNPKEDVIYVPDGVLTSEMEITNGNHVLFYDGEWNVLHSQNGWPPSISYQFMIVPCKREELKAGDVAICYIPDGDTDINSEKEYLSSYCIVTDKGIVFWDEEDSGVNVCNYELNSDYVWYKVVEA